MKGMTLRQLFFFLGFYIHFSPMVFFLLGLMLAVDTFSFSSDFWWLLKHTNYFHIMGFIEYRKTDFGNKNKKYKEG